MQSINEWDEKPNGCADEEHWKECYRNGWVKKGCFCKHPGGQYVDNRDGFPICRHHPNAMPIKAYNQSNDNDEPYT